MNIDIREILRKLSGVKKVKDGYIASCPSHSDSNPSFSVKETSDGCIFHCFAGCDFSSIVQALGLNDREHYERREHREQVEQPEREQTKRIVDTYKYVDENGNLLYEIVRYEPKDFRVRRPDGKGGYDWGFGDARKVIYQLPEVIKAREKKYFIFFCEGEKDVNNVIENFDFPATTIATGANAWKDEYVDFFSGLNVVILPDNDKSGNLFAEKVANSIYGKADSVTVVQLPNLLEKGDVSDWINNGGTREQLIDLVAATPEWQLKETIEYESDVSKYNKENFFICKPVSEWLEEAMKTPIPKMLFGEFWFEEEISILFADTNVGKSTLAVQIADSISKGKQIGSLKCEIQPQEVLYFDFELNSRQFGNRYGKNVDGFLKEIYPFDTNFIRVEINPDNDISVTGNFEDILLTNIEKMLVENDAKVLIIDNITYLKDDNEKTTAALSLMKRLKNLKQKYGLSVLALAHTPKRNLDRPINNLCTGQNVLKSVLSAS